MVVLRDKFWLRYNVGYQIVVGTLGGRWENEWLVVKNSPVMFKVFDITGYGVGRDWGDFVAINVGSLKAVYVRMIALHSYIFIICVAVPMLLIAENIFRL